MTTPMVSTAITPAAEAAMRSFDMPRRAQGGQFSRGGEAAQAEKAADQRGVAEHLVQAPWHREHDVRDGVVQREAVLADISQLAHELRERVETGQHQPDEEQGTEDAGADQPVGALDGQRGHQWAPLTRRALFCRQKYQAATPNTMACNTQMGAEVCRWPLMICARAINCQTT